MTVNGRAKGVVANGAAGHGHSAVIEHAAAVPDAISALIVVNMAAKHVKSAEIPNSAILIGLVFGDSTVI